MVESRDARYVHWLCDSTPETIRRWVPEEQLRRELGDFFDQVWVERVETPEWLDGYARACAVDGAEPPDYRMREIEVLPDAAVLAGIHFRHRDVHHPFVDVFAQSRNLNDAEMETSTSALSEAFRLFNPHTVRWWAPEQRDLSTLPDAVRDERLVVGRIQDVTSAPPALLPGRFSFEPESPTRSYDDYERAYAEFSAQATFRNVPRPERLATLEECQNRGALYCLRDRGRFAGLMAARPHALRGIRGWEVVEEILGTEHRGISAHRPAGRTKRRRRVVYHSLFMDLKNATALVTGGSSGIGLAIARVLVDAGTQVAITGRDQGRLSAAAKEIGAHGINADVSNEEDVKRTYHECLQKFDHLDILVNSAGFGLRAPLIEMDRAKFEAVFQTNVTGTMLMSREAAKHFIERKSGNIVNLGSTAALRGAANGTAYYASKFAVRGMTECWRAELRQHNIRVFLVNPSEVLTNFATNAGFSQDDDNPTKLQAEDIAHVVKAALEMHDRGFTTELTVFATNPKD